MSNRALISSQRQWLAERQWELMRRRLLPGSRVQILAVRAWEQRRKTEGESVKRGGIGHKGAMVKVEAVIILSPFINIRLESYFAYVPPTTQQGLEKLCPSCSQSIPPLLRRAGDGGA